MAHGKGDWVFGLADNGEWEWRYRNRDSDGDVERSSGTFRAFLECMADAQQHGYVPLAAMSSSRLGVTSRPES
jgi:hypothetical protein